MYCLFKSKIIFLSQRIGVFYAIFSKRLVINLTRVLYDFLIALNDFELVNVWVIIPSAPPLHFEILSSTDHEFPYIIFNLNLLFNSKLY